MLHVKKTFPKENPYNFEKTHYRSPLHITAYADSECTNKLESKQKQTPKFLMNKN